MIRITSLEQLKQWNSHPTEEKPIVLEWFLDWFFEELLDMGKTEEAIEARNVMIEFSMLCEGMSREEATSRVDSNFDHYAGHSVTRWEPKWRALLKVICSGEKRALAPSTGIHPDDLKGE